MSAQAVSAIETALAEASDADDGLRETVRLLASIPGIEWAGIAFVEGEDVVLGPWAGVPDESRRTLVTLCYKGHAVGELRVDGSPDPALLDAVADLVAAYALLGWDTGGEAWEP